VTLSCWISPWDALKSYQTKNAQEARAGGLRKTSQRRLKRRFVFDMENPRAINRFFLVMFIALTFVAFATSVSFHNFYILPGFLVAIPLMFGFVGIINMILFIPVFWLMAKFAAPKPQRVNSADRGA
jgi:hypothetical protein